MTIPPKPISMRDLRNYLDKSMVDPGKVSGPEADDLRAKFPYLLGLARMLPSDFVVTVPYTAPPDQYGEPPTDSQGTAANAPAPGEPEPPPPPPDPEIRYALAVSWPPKRWP